MAVSQTVISAYKRCYTTEQLRSALMQALNDRASGVQVTQATFQDGSGAGQMISGDPNEVIETIEICLQQIEAGDDYTPPALSTAVNFRTRRAET